jgi:hypothetical protein
MMILNDNNELPPQLIIRLLKFGISGLSQLRHDLIDAFFLDEDPDPKTLFRTEHRMHGHQVLLGKNCLSPVPA